MVFTKGHPFYDSPIHYKGGRHKKDACKRGHALIEGNFVGNGRDCKTCHRTKSYEWKRKDNLKKLGLTIDGWNLLFEKQNGRCAICFKHQTEFKVKLVVDHDHKSGKIRALLCHACNLVLGNAKEDASILQRCIVYFKMHEDQ